MTRPNLEIADDDLARILKTLSSVIGKRAKQMHGMKATRAVELSRDLRRFRRDMAEESGS